MGGIFLNFLFANVLQHSVNSCLCIFLLNVNLIRKVCVGWRVVVSDSRSLGSLSSGLTTLALIRGKVDHSGYIPVMYWGFKPSVYPLWDIIFSLTVPRRYFNIFPYNTCVQLLCVFYMFTLFCFPMYSSMEKNQG